MRSKGRGSVKAAVFQAGRRLQKCRYCKSLLVPGHAVRHVRCVLQHLAAKRAEEGRAA